MPPPVSLCSTWCLGGEAQIPANLVHGTAVPIWSLQNRLWIISQKQEWQVEQKDSWQPTPLAWLLNPQVPCDKSKKLHTGPHKVVKEISDVTYRIQHVKNMNKRLVVHFDRLNTSYPQTCLNDGSSNTLFQPMEPQDSELAESQVSEEPSIQFGTHLEIVKDSNTDEWQHSYGNQVQLPTRDQNQEQLPIRRYPTWMRQSPDYFTWIRDVFLCNFFLCIIFWQEHIKGRSIQLTYIVHCGNIEK